MDGVLRDARVSWFTASRSVPDAVSRGELPQTPLPRSLTRRIEKLRRCSSALEQLRADAARSAHDYSVHCVESKVTAESVVRYGQASGSHTGKHVCAAGSILERVEGGGASVVGTCLHEFCSAVGAQLQNNEVAFASIKTVQKAQEDLDKVVRKALQLRSAGESRALVLVQKEAANHQQRFEALVQSTEIAIDAALIESDQCVAKGVRQILLARQHAVEAIQAALDNARPLLNSLGGLHSDSEEAVADLSTSARESAKKLSVNEELGCDTWQFDLIDLIQSPSLPIIITALEVAVATRSGASSFIPSMLRVADDLELCVALLRELIFAEYKGISASGGVVMFVSTSTAREVTVEACKMVGHSFLHTLLDNAKRSIEEIKSTESNTTYECTSNSHEKRIFDELLECVLLSLKNVPQLWVDVVGLVWEVYESSSSASRGCQMSVAALFVRQIIAPSFIENGRGNGWTQSISQIRKFGETMAFALDGCSDAIAVSGSQDSSSFLSTAAQAVLQAVGVLVDQLQNDSSATRVMTSTEHETVETEVEDLACVFNFLSDNKTNIMATLNRRGLQDESDRLCVHLRSSAPSVAKLGLDQRKRQPEKSGPKTLRHSKRVSRMIEFRGETERKSPAMARTVNIAQIPSTNTPSPTSIKPTFTSAVTLPSPKSPVLSTPDFPVVNSTLSSSMESDGVEHHNDSKFSPAISPDDREVASSGDPGNGADKDMSAAIAAATAAAPFAGNVTGVGIELEAGRDNLLRIAEILPDSAAERCGSLKTGDVVREIDGTRVSRLRDPMGVVPRLLLGPPGTSLVLGVARGSKVSYIELLRDSKNGPDSISDAKAAAVERRSSKSVTLSVPGIGIGATFSGAVVTSVTLQSCGLCVGDKVVAVDSRYVGEYDDLNLMVEGAPGTFTELLVVGISGAERIVRAPRAGVQATRDGGSPSAVSERMVGIGATFKRDRTDGRYRVKRLQPGHPTATQELLQIGDCVVAVDDISVVGCDSTALTKRIVGPRGSTVKLSLLRGGEIRVVTIKRGGIEEAMWKGAGE